MTETTNNDNDHVSEIFRSLIAALKHHSDDIRLECAEAIIDGRFDITSQLSEKIMAVQTFCKEMESFSVRWSNGLPSSSSNDTQRRLGKARGSEIACSKRSKHSKLHVSINGQTFDQGKACDIFAAAVEKVGLERVSKLDGMEFGGTPLVSRKKTDDYKDQRFIDGWYITTHFNNEQKKQILNQLSERLHIPIHVRLVVPD